MTKEEIEKMDYSSIVGLLNERNRPSGGIKTVQEVCLNTFLTKESKVLEIGSNTGFTSVNVKLLSGSKIVGIDINKISIEKAEEYAKNHSVDVDFVLGSATSLPFENKEFDMVWASNVTSFIGEKGLAVKEYSRVLKYGGYLVVIPIYYIKEPPEEIINEVSIAINSKIEVWNKEYWLNLVEKTFENLEEKFELTYSSDYVYENQEKNIDNYVSTIIKESGLHNFLEQEITLLKSRYTNFIDLFNKNLKYCGYSILVFQKRKVKDQVELFISKKI